MSAKRDYYEVLGVERSADEEQLKKAYRKLAMQWHPDVAKTPDAEVRFKEINEAYQVLSNPEKRTMYDRFGHAGVSPNGAGAADFGGFGFGGGLGDIFEEFFSGFGMGNQRRSRQGPRRGADLRYDLEITLEEAVFGVEKKVDLARLETCSRCGGNGAEPGTSPETCPQCQGTGEVRRVQQSLLGSFVNVAACPRCNGEGAVVSSPCTECHGQKRVRHTRTVSLSIPKGVDDGTQIRLSGEGESGVNGGPAGNLYVVLSVKPHPLFLRRDNDLYVEVPVNFAQAGLGAALKVPTLEGDEEQLKVPAGTQTGEIFRIRGRGVPFLRRQGRGDLIVAIRVATPRKLNDQQRELLQKLGATMGDEPLGDRERGSLFDRMIDALGEALKG